MSPFYERMRLNRGKIMVKLIDAPKRSGLLVQAIGNDERKPKYGEVVNVGPARIADSGVVFPMLWQIGDRVMLNGLPGTDLAVDGQSIRIIHEDGDTHGLVPLDAWDDVSQHEPPMPP